MRPLQRLRACARSRGCSDPCCHAHGTMACSTSAFMHASAGVTATAWCSGMADVGRNLRGSAPELGGLTALRLVEGSLALEGLRFEAPEQCWSSGGWLIVESCSSWCLEAASGSMRVGPGGRSMRGESLCRHLLLKRGWTPVHWRRSPSRCAPRPVRAQTRPQAGYRRTASLIPTTAHPARAPNSQRTPARLAG